MRQQKKRQMRHGLTTCFVFPTKDSNNYVKRDLNQDVFCKINSHLGDVDNDPHTPRSNGSMRSIEKAKKRSNMNFNQSEIENSGFHPTFTMNQGFRVHSVSVDDKIMEVKRF